MHILGPYPPGAGTLKYNGITEGLRHWLQLFLCADLLLHVQVFQTKHGVWDPEVNPDWSIAF